MMTTTASLDWAKMTIPATLARSAAIWPKVSAVEEGSLQPHVFRAGDRRRRQPPAPSWPPASKRGDRVGDLGPE